MRIGELFHLCNPQVTAASEASPDRRRGSLWAAGLFSTCLLMLISGCSNYSENSKAETTSRAKDSGTSPSLTPAMLKRAQQLVGHTFRSVDGYKQVTFDSPGRAVLAVRGKTKICQLSLQQARPNNPDAAPATADYTLTENEAGFVDSDNTVLYAQGAPELVLADSMRQLAERRQNAPNSSFAVAGSVSAPDGQVFVTDDLAIGTLSDTELPSHAERGEGEAKYKMSIQWHFTRTTPPYSRGNLLGVPHWYMCMRGIDGNRHFLTASAKNAYFVLQSSDSQGVTQSTSSPSWYTPENIPNSLVIYVRQSDGQ
jgi:hypothetical protein